MSLGSFLLRFVTVYPVIGLVFAIGLLRPCVAQLPENVALRLGLETAWHAQVQLPVSAKPVVSTHLWPSSEGARQFAETTVKGRLIRVYADQPGPDGKPIGIAAAKEEAKKRAARMLGTFSGVEVSESSIPKIYFVVITSDGVVQTFDAETGQSLWRAESGSSRFPVSPGSVGKVGVAVTSGSHLYLFDWASGKHSKTMKLRTATSAGVALTSTMAIVPSFSGVVGAYALGEPSLHPWQYTGHGIPMHAPVAALHSSPSLAAIITDRGFMYVFADEAGSPAPWYRFSTQSPMAAVLSASPSGFYIGDINGNLFKIATSRRGELKWRYSMGTPIVHDPLVVANRAYFVNQGRLLYALNDVDGSESWSSPASGIQGVLSASKTRLYALGTGNSLVVIDTATGKALAASAPNTISNFAANQVNDRLYLIGRDGQLQCLRENAAVQPTMHFQPPVEPTDKQKLQPGTAESQLAPEVPATVDSSDPFGSAAAGEPAADATATVPAANPFGTEATPPAETPAGANPFATSGADPFTPN